MGAGKTGIGERKLNILYFPNRGILAYGDTEPQCPTFYDDEEKIRAAEKSVKGETDGNDSYGPVRAELELPDGIAQAVLGADANS